MSRSDDSTIPIGHHQVVAVIEPIRARAVADAFLALLKLLEQPEVARDYI
jgi:hypothetical protein